MAEVKSFEELKLKIQELIESYERQQSVRRSMRDDKGVRELGMRLKEIYWFRNLINSFEAWVRERLKKQMKEVEKGSSIQYELFVEARAECSELRRILEGEGGEKEKG